MRYTNKMNRIDLEDVRSALKKARIDKNVGGFKETNVQRIGKSVTSIIEIDDEIKIFSKCYDLSLYPEIKAYNPLEKQLSEEYDEDLFLYEKKILETLNDIDKNIAPQLLSVVENQQRIFMEYVKEPSLQRKFMQIDKEIYKLEKKIDKKNNKDINDTRDEIQNLKRQKEYWTKKGLYNITKFNNICENNKNRFRNLGVRGVSKKEDRLIFEDYLFRILLYHNQGLKNKEGIIMFLKDRGVNLGDYSSRIAEYFSKSTEDEKMTLIHGDLGPQHIRLNGKIIDFDEFKEGSYYYDVVRFLKNPFVNQPEKKIPMYLADYLARFIQKDINEKENEGLSIENIVNNIIGRENFALSLKKFYDVNLKEDIHIVAVLRKYSPKAVKFFTDDHPNYRSKSSLIKWRLNDINNILQTLLSDYGREYLLRDNYSMQNIESIRSFFEITGLIKIPTYDIFGLVKPENHENPIKNLKNNHKVYA